MKNFYEGIVGFVRYLRVLFDFYLVNQLIIVAGVFYVLIMIDVSSQQNVYIFLQIEPQLSLWAVWLLKFFTFIKQLFLLLFWLLCLFVGIANITLLYKKNFLFLFKVLLNLPFIVVAIIFFQYFLSKMLGIFYLPAVQYGQALLAYLGTLSPLSPGVFFVIAGVYNLFYLNGYRYVPHQQ